MKSQGTGKILSESMLWGRGDSLWKIDVQALSLYIVLNSRLDSGMLND